ncbi:CapA family protein [Myxococcota bacterium]
MSSFKRVARWRLGLASVAVLAAGSGCAREGKSSHQTRGEHFMVEGSGRIDARCLPDSPNASAGAENADCSPPEAPTAGQLNLAETGPERYGNADDVDNDLFEEERLSRTAFAWTPISLSGIVIDVDGRAVVGASVTAEGLEASTDQNGAFVFEQLPRRNVELRIRARGFKPTVAYVHLAIAVDQANTTALPMVLTPDVPDVVRFLFAGDTAFGRRFLNPSEQTPPLEIPAASDAALIDASNPASGTQAALRHVRALFENADYPVVNLETPVTSTPAEYHSFKAYIFYSLPESLNVFPWLGVRYVSLGNNHVYDYLEDGLADTLESLALRGIATSGAGLSPDEAFVPHREQLGGSTYSFVSLNSVSGNQTPLLYVASDNPLKGGSADLRDDTRVIAAIRSERDKGHFPVVQLHTGREYTYWPTDYARGRMSLAVQSGAALVIGHHPHVAQGFIHENGTLIAGSLGNFCFDQARLETMLGLVVAIDMQGDQVVSASGLSVYLEDYTPRPVTGELSAYLSRRIGELSVDTTVLLEEDRARVLPSGSAIVTHSRRELIEFEIHENGNAIVDLRGHRRSSESLVEVAGAIAQATLQAGQDILVFGDFEDWDVDAEELELARWDVTGPSTFPCVSNPYRGAVSLCSTRQEQHEANSVVAFRNRVRVLGEAVGTPNKDLSLVGYIQGDNAGRSRIEVQYYASVGEREFEREEAYQHPGGTFRWESFSADLNVPPDKPKTDPLTENPHALRLFIVQEPPASGEAVRRLDDIAVVSWREARSLDAPLGLTSPNPIDFLRVRGPTGIHTLTLVWQSSSLGPTAALSSSTSTAPTPGDETDPKPELLISYEVPSFGLSYGVRTGSVGTRLPSGRSS